MDDYVDLREVANRLGRLLHDLVRLSLAHLLDHDLRGVLPLGNEVIEHLEVVVIDLLDLLVVRLLSFLKALLVVLEVLHNHLNAGDCLKPGGLSHQDDVL
jgi:hypothetical protein